MLAWQVPYLGWRHLPTELSEFEISRFFTFEPVVHRAIRSRYKDFLRLGAALQIGFLTMCGRTLHAFQRVPATLRLDLTRFCGHLSVYKEGVDHGEQAQGISSRVSASNG